MQVSGALILATCMVNLGSSQRPQILSLLPCQKQPSKSLLFEYNLQLALMFFVLLVSFLSTYFGLVGLAVPGIGTEKVANISMVDAIF